MLINLLNIITTFKKIFKFFIFIFIIYALISDSLDVTELPQKSDLIVSLGGDSELNRIKKAANLFKNNYANTILITGYNEKIKYKNLNLKRLTYLEGESIDINQIYIAYNTKNTLSEIIYIYNFMKFNSLKSALIVTDPPHSLRIQAIIKLMKFNKDIKFSIISSNPNWWDFYKLNHSSLEFILKECIKIPFNILKIFFYQSKQSI